MSPLRGKARSRVCKYSNTDVFVEQERNTSPNQYLTRRLSSTCHGHNTVAVVPFIRAGKLDEAEPLYRKAVEIGESVLGPDHPDLATWLNNLATLVRDRGDLDAAEPLQRRALSIGEKVLGPAHPDLGAQIINLASLLTVRGVWRVGAAVFGRA